MWRPGCAWLVLAAALVAQHPPLPPTAANPEPAHPQQPHPKRSLPPPVHEPHPALPPAAALAHLRAGNASAIAARAQTEELPPPLPRPAGAGRFVAAVITCADAAAPVPQLFGLRPADVLLLGNAGAVADPDGTALIEWAAAHERLSLVVVLTHANCPSLAAGPAAGDRPAVGGADERGALARQWATRRRLPLATAQAQVQCERLLAASSALRALVAADRLRVVPASVDDDGRVTWHTSRADELPLQPIR